VEEASDHQAYEEASEGARKRALQPPPGCPEAGDECANAHARKRLGPALVKKPNGSNDEGKEQRGLQRMRSALGAPEAKS